MKLSNKVEAMQFSPIRKFNPIAQKAKDAGKKVYHLNIGQPDVETPACFMDAIRSYREQGHRLRRVRRYHGTAGRCIRLLQDLRHEHRQGKHDRYHRWF